MDIPRQVVSFLSSRGLMLATAESCTAGYIASLISSVPGSGSCLDVGFVTYSPTGKAGFLGVREETMKRFGLTSEEVAREMSEGALAQEACCADVAVSNTGVADARPATVRRRARSASRGRTSGATAHRDLQRDPSLRGRAQ